MTTRTKTRTIYRSAKTGRMVTAAYAKRHPATTVAEIRPVPRRKPRPKIGANGARKAA